MEIKEGYVYQFHIDKVEGGILSIEVLKDNGDYLVVSVDGKVNDEFPRYLLQNFCDEYDYEVKKAEVRQSEEPIEKQIETKTENVKPKVDTPSKFWFYIIWPLSLLFFLSLLFVIVYGIGSCTYDIIKDKVNPEPKINIIHKDEKPKSTERELTEEEKEWEQKTLKERRQIYEDNTLVIISDEDSIYHTVTDCDSLSPRYRYRRTAPPNINLKKYHFSTEGYVKENNYKECNCCMEIEGVYTSFEAGDLINEYDADEYCSHSEE